MTLSKKAWKSDPISRSVLALKLRSGWQKAVVALANKNARILWAVMTKEVDFDRHHVSEKPKPTAPVGPAVPASAAVCSLFLTSIRRVPIQSNQCSYQYEMKT